MTDTAFYDDMEALATELLADFGTPATLREITIGKPNAEGKATKTTSDSAGLAVQTESKVVVDRLAKNIEAAYVYKGPVKAQNGHHLIHGGVTWEVSDLKHVSPEGTRLMVSFLGVKRT